MAIENVEVLDSNRELIGIIDTFKSVIWHNVFFGVGDFEVYAPATPEIIALIMGGLYIKLPDDLEVGIIEKIEIAKTNKTDQ